MNILNFCPMKMLHVIFIDDNAYTCSTIVKK